MSQKEKPKILIAIDSPDTLEEKPVEILKETLLTNNYVVIEAKNGAEVVEKAVSLTPDLILLDVLMPDSNGFEVCQKLRARKETLFLPIVMMTELKDKRNRILGIEAGADDFISKPKSILWDDTELLTRVKSLLRIKQLREEIERLKEDYTAMLVHDLRAPLTSIQGFAQMIRAHQEADKLSPEVLRECLDPIINNSRKMLDLVNDILNLSKLESGSLELETAPCDVRQLLENISKDARKLAGSKNITLVTTLPASLPIMEIDANQIEQVMDNILNNALKFTPNGGQINLSAKLIDDEEADGVSTLLVSIVDTGPGIPSDMLESIFDKYNQVKMRSLSERVGSGLGLAISKMIVEAHRGKIWCESEVSKGSVFHFKLPV